MLCQHWAAKQRDVHTTAHNANATTAQTPRTGCTTQHAAATPRASALLVLRCCSRPPRHHLAARRASALPCSSCVVALVRPAAT